jgi:hypothetical protein
LKKIKKFEIVLFVFLLFAQNFAIIKTKNFGISTLTIYLIFLFFKYRMYQKFKFRNIIFTIICFIIFFISLFFNGDINIFRILRWLMIGCVLILTLKYIEIIYKWNMEKWLWKIFFRMSVLISIYGLYEYIANIYKLPLFLNVFSNNPSYGVRGLTKYYGGWVDFPRISTMFFEPSAYAIFLVGVIVLLFNSKYVNKKKKYFIGILLLINELMTFSRSGWGILLYTFICFIIVTLIIRAKFFRIFYYLVNKIILFIPFMNLFFMYLGNKYIFNDLSSKARTNSGIFYLVESFKNFKVILFGHGVGAMSENYANNLWKTMYIEKYAHNGYIEFIYEFGWVLFILIVLYTYVNIDKIKKYKNKILALSFISSICSFGTVYNIESILVMIILVYSYNKFESLK